MKRNGAWPWILLLSALSALPCGCGSEEAKATLRIANWGGAGDDSEFQRTIREIFQEFGTANRCRVLQEGIPGSQDYVSKMLLNFVAKSTPDIMTVDASSASVFVDNGALMDLSPYLARDKDISLDEFFPNVVDICRRGDKVYAIPGDFTPMVLYYNKRLFDQAGVPYPDGNWNFAEFREAAAKLTIKDKQYGFAFSNWMPGWIMFLWNNGADVLSPDGTKAGGFIDSPKAVEAVTFLRDLVNAGYAPSLSASAATGVDFFATGRAAMGVSGHWAITGYKESKDIKMSEIGVAPLPTNLAKSVTVMYEAGLAISKEAKNPDLAWKYLKFFTSYAIQKRYNKTGIAVDARKDVAAERGTDPLERAFLDIVPSARPPWGSRVMGYDYLETAGTKAMEAILQGADPKTALTEAARRIDAYFQLR
ncbi:MAG: sugar ABC transporter substrate-binding protein [Armatimonadetes bacterium]|nr:sugar ABC transporter substrate-binding protein [Armatimonadota bacterium]